MVQKHLHLTLSGLILFFRYFCITISFSNVIVTRILIQKVSLKKASVFLWDITAPADLMSRTTMSLQSLSTHNCKSIFYYSSRIAKQSLQHGREQLLHKVFVLFSTPFGAQSANTMKS